MKTGREHIAQLRDKRAVYIDGARVDDVTRHPAFARATGTIAALYDFSSDPANRELMSFDTGDGGRANRIWELPGSYAALQERRRALEAWAGLHAGFMGRAPDHVASCLAGMVMGLEVFEAYDPARAGALAEYYRYARDRDLYLTYVIINPQADRSKPASQQADPYLSAGVVDRDAGGITVRGAKMLATGGVMANEVLVTCIQPLQPGDERYALSFAIPMNTRGLKVLSRKSYEAAAPSVFDNPLSSRFDENDAVLYFDDVRVPWDRVFVVDSVAMVQRQFHATPAHVYQNYQAMIRLSVKLRFLVGVARRLAEMNGTLGFPQIRDTLGQLAAEAAMVDALVVAMEAKGTAARRVFRARRPHAVRGPGADPAAVSQGRQHAARAGGRRHDHAALFRRGLSQSGDRQHHRQDPAIAGCRRGGPGEVLQARLGCGGVGVRLPPSAVRDVLRRCDLRAARPLVPHL